MIKQKYCKYLLLLCLLLSSTQYSVADIVQNSVDKFAVRFAVVDIQSILERSIALQEIRKSVDQFNQDIQTDALKARAELEEVEKKLNQKRVLLDAAVFDEEVNKFHKKVSDVQKKMQMKKIKLEQAHAEAVGKVYEITINIIADLAKKYDLTLVLPSTQILYAAGNLDITSEVIKSLNSKITSVKINYP